MPNNNKWIEMFLVLVVFGMTGCTVSTNYNEGGHPPPDDWVKTVSHNAKECQSINGEYQNFGEGRQTREDPLSQTRLDVALGHTFPTVEIPERVRITLEDDSNVLRYAFIGPVSQSFLVTVTCSDGWYTWAQTMTDKYLGDGTNLDYSIRDIRLAKALSGGLIVHLNLEIQSSSFWLHKSRDKMETWSKYEELNSEN